MVVLGNIVGELASVFPGPYMHIGGDEVSGDGWKERQKGFELRYAALVREAGKTPVMWDEALESWVSGVIHWWRADHPEALEKALASGYQTIISPWDPFYLDYIGVYYYDFRDFERHPEPRR